MLRFATLAAALLLSSGAVLPIPLASQAVDGEVEGYVLDEMGRPIPSVVVTVEGPSLQGTKTIRSDDRGYFRSTGLPVGAYSVTLAAPGYQPAVVRNVVVQLGRTASLETIRLATATLELAPIEVQAEAAMLDVSSTTVGVNLPASVFANLPIERDYRSMVTLLPHANSTFLSDGSSLGGATGYESVFHIDGVNVTDPIAPGGGTRLPYNFVDEVRVKIGGYEAEFGRALGGIVDVVTHSGSDQFEGSVFGYFTHDALATTPRLAVLQGETGGTGNIDVGGSIGGPLARQRLWFYGAYNLNTQTDDALVPGIGEHRSRRTAHLFAGKLTWRASDATDVTLSLFGDPTIEQAVGNSSISFWGSAATLLNPEPFLYRHELGGVNTSLRARHQVAPSFSLEATASRYTNKELRTPDTQLGQEEPLFIDVSTATWSGGGGLVSDRTTTRNTARATGTAFFDAHTVKGGFEYQVNGVVDRSTFHAAGTAENVGVVRDLGGTFEGFHMLFDTDGGDRVITSFLQDSWQVSQRLRVNAGIRWANQYFIGKGDSVAQSITGQLQPRVGFIYEPGTELNQKLFGSLGRYYLQIPLQMSAAFHNRQEQCLYAFSSDPRDPNAETTGTVCFSTLDDPPYPKKNDVLGEFTDEVTLGYERTFSGGARLAVRGIYRTLREAYINGFLGEPPFIFAPGNPGRSDLASLPDPRREYTALELTAEKTGSGPLQFFATYVLSRSYGNYPGQFTSDTDFDIAGNQLAFQLPEHDEMATGVLPSDRPHVFKFFGSYHFPFGLTAGMSGFVQSGTPLNRFGQSEVGARPRFLLKRGTAGRTPALWDLDFRVTYDLLGITGGTSRLILDVRNVGSPRTAVFFDQYAFLSLDTDGNQANPNPSYLQALAYQLPMSVRLGAELHW